MRYRPPDLPPTIRRSGAYAVLVVVALIIFLAPLHASAQGTDAPSLELTRAARPWEFISSVGKRSGLLGNESGNFEAWVYPLKLLRNFHLRFRVDDELLEAKDVVRSVRVRPEATTITYAWDTFTVRETLLTPVDEPGALIQLQIDTVQPLQIEVGFERDFQLEWPGAMGGSDIEWNPLLHAFSMTENQQKFTALVGSPAATAYHLEYVTNYSAGKENSLYFGNLPKGSSTRLIVMAASFDGLPPANVTYRKLTESYEQLLAASAAYYQSYRSDHVRVELPDATIQQAYEWAQVSVLQGLVTNPYLGTGFVAGYRPSGEDQRPGYAWFFGRDALWTALGLDAEGDFASARTALAFLSKYQRADGKVTHEIAQGASFVPWFNMPYAYASADATPLFIVAMADYVKSSGDISFATDQWDHLACAYQFIVSTYDAVGLPKNEGVGHGWIEGGPLYPSKTELYQLSVVVQALQSLADIAKYLGKAGLQAKYTSEADREKSLIDQIFWMPESQRFAFALDMKSQKADETSVLAAVPMWFHLLDPEKAHSTIVRLSEPDIQTNWGMRIISSNDPKYDAAGYHSGTVWPLFTGWASVGEYKYHATAPAFANLRDNALLTFDGSLGHVTEVLTGADYQPLATSSPQQIWSSSMVVSSLLTGLFGLETDALTSHVSLSPHLPADWKYFNLQQVRAGSCLLNIGFEKTVNQLTFHVRNVSNAKCSLDLSPALSLRSRAVRATLNGHTIPFKVEKNGTDQHVKLHLDPSTSDELLEVSLKDDFGIFQKIELPSLGSPNAGLRLIDEAYSPDRKTLTLSTASITAGTYEFGLWNPAQVASVDGAELSKISAETGKLRLTVPPIGDGVTVHGKVVLHFSTTASSKKIDTQDP